MPNGSAIFLNIHKITVEHTKVRIQKYKAQKNYKDPTKVIQTADLTVIY